MNYLHHTPPRRSIRRAAIDANSRLTAMLTPARGRRSTVGVSSAAKEQDETVVKILSKAEFGDEDGLSAAEASDTEEKECCICLEEPSDDDIATINGCEHKFCVDCITRWSDANNVCPLCRTRFTSIESAGGVLHQVHGMRRPAAAVGINLAGLFNLEEVIPRGGGNGGRYDVIAGLIRQLRDEQMVTQQLQLFTDNSLEQLTQSLANVGLEPSRDETEDA
jgi:hypothetical protein